MFIFIYVFLLFVTNKFCHSGTIVVKIWPNNNIKFILGQNILSIHWYGFKGDNIIQNCAHICTKNISFSPEYQFLSTLLESLQISHYDYLIWIQAIFNVSYMQIIICPSRMENSNRARWHFNNSVDDLLQAWNLHLSIIWFNCSNHQTLLHQISR